MKTHIIRRALLALGICSALNMQAQAPHPERIYLSGTGTDYTRTWEFYCSKGQNSGKWKSIEVPSCWELQGFGEYTYGRYYTIKGAKPSDETGIYRYRFLTPDCGKTDRVKLFFDGVMTDAEVWVNGKSAGQIHQGAFYRFSYDITSLLKTKGENLLEVKVAKQSANKSVNAAERRADWWLYGGIYRPVWGCIHKRIERRKALTDTARQRAGQLSACHLRQRNRVYMQVVGCKSLEYRSAGTLCGASGTERPQRKRYSGS